MCHSRDTMSRTNAELSTPRLRRVSQGLESALLYMKKVKNCTKLVPFFARDGRLRPKWTFFTLFVHYFENTHSNHSLPLSGIEQGITHMVRTNSENGNFPSSCVARE